MNLKMKPKTLEAPPTLAGEINKTADELLQRIVAEYKDKVPGEIKQEVYDVLVQSCKKLMEKSSVIRTEEIEKLKF